jgi:hypothetical protein
VPCFADSSDSPRVSKKKKLVSQKCSSILISFSRFLCFKNVVVVKRKSNLIFKLYNLKVSEYKLSQWSNLWNPTLKIKTWNFYNFSSVLIEKSQKLPGIGWSKYIRNRLKMTATRWITDKKSAFFILRAFVAKNRANQEMTFFDS